MSPASRARSSSAARRMSSITSGRRSANSAVSSSRVSARPSRARSIAPGARSARIGTSAPPAGAAPRDERPVLELDRVEHALRDPFLVDVLRVDAEALGQRVALGLQLLAHLVRARERHARARCGRRSRRGRRGRSRPPRTRSSHQSERFGGIWMPTSGISSPAAPHEPLDVVDRDRSRPTPGAARRPSRARRRRAHHAAARRRPRSRPPRGRSSRGCGTKFWRITSWMWPWRPCTSASASSEAMRSLLGLADPDQDAARERDAQLARGLDRREAHAPGASSASPRAPSPSGARRRTPASAPSTRSPRAGERGRRAPSTPRFECGSRPRSSARSQAQTT